MQIHQRNLRILLSLLCVISSGWLLRCGILWSLAGMAAAVLLYPSHSKHSLLIKALILLLLAGFLFCRNRNENTSASEKLIVSFLDVGQGDSILIEAPDGKAFLIDAGTRDSGSSVVSAIKSAGIQSIDYMIETHPHADHIGGFPEVIRSFSIKSYIKPYINDFDVPQYPGLTHLKQTLKDHSIPVREVSAGDTIVETDDYCLSVLSPSSDAVFDDLNDYSLILKLTYGKTSFLFTGDAGYMAELELLDQNIRTDVLKVGHHGSFGSTCTAFLEETDPDIAIISVGKNNENNHPNQYVLDRLDERGIPVYRTDASGTITVISDGNSVSVSTENHETDTAGEKIPLVLG